jgi:hypothetical protein
VLFVLFGVILYFMPVSIQSTRQANFISKWNEMYNKVDYMFQVIHAQISDDVIKNASKMADDERERLLLLLVKPYLRINTEKTVPKRYKPRYVNGARVYKGQEYHFDDMFLTEDNKVVGVKDLKGSSGKPTFMLMFDINGFIPPNTWGKDIFGINIFEDGHIEAFGQGLAIDKLRHDCLSTGIGCSHYYKIGGGFVE